MTNAEQTTSDLKGDHLSLKMFGAKGDTRALTVAATSGSAVVSGTFSVADVGKRIVIYGAGGSGTQVNSAFARVSR